MKLFRAIILAPLSLVWNGFVFTKLWAWFVAPTFDLPSLSIPTAIGIELLLVLVFSGNNSEKSKKFADVLIFSFAFPLVVLVTAWIVFQFN